MATKFRLRRSATADKRPIESDLLLGELALNTYDGRLYTKRDTNNVGIADTAALLTPWTENFGGGSIYYSNSVGIGSDNPQKNLDIYTGQAHATLRLHNLNNGGTGYDSELSILGSASNSEMRINMGVNSDPDREQIKSYQSNLIFTTNTDERLRILSTGEVAIGGAGYAGQPFSVQTSGNNLGYMQSTGTTRAVMNFVDANSTVNVGFGAIGDNHVFMKDAVEKVRIDSSGRVLIGTTTEGNATADDLTIETSGNTGMTIRSGTSNEGNIFFSDGTSGDAEYRGMLRYEHNNDAMVIKTAASERLRINSTGKVGIGTDNPSSWVHLQTVSTTGDEDLIRFSRSQYEVGKIRRSAGAMRISGEGNLHLEADYNANLGASDSNILFNIDGGEKVRITYQGRVGIGSAIPDYMLDVSGAINSETDVKVGGVSVSETALNDAVAMAIALG